MCGCGAGSLPAAGQGRRVVGDEDQPPAGADAVYAELPLAAAGAALYWLRAGRESE